MKYGTLVVTKVTAGLYQQGVFSESKKNDLLKTWSEADRKGDTETQQGVVNELLSATRNKTWSEELNKVWAYI